MESRGDGRVGKKGNQEEGRIAEVQGGEGRGVRCERSPVPNLPLHHCITVTQNKLEVSK